MDELMSEKSNNTKSFNLNNSTLGVFNFIKPTYDRTQLSPGIVHIGVGNFHRAHFSWYVHRLMQEGKAFDWAIIGSGVQNYDIQMREKLQKQDYLTTLIELSPDGNKSCEIIGPMIDYVPVEKNNRSLIKVMTNPSTRIVSLTATEGGYYLNSNKTDLDLSHQDILHDINNPESPRTVFGAIVCALDIRRKEGDGPFTCLSCDNLIKNGDKLKQLVLGIAKKNNIQLYNWIEENCTFPNSMLDCIVPTTGERELKLISKIGINDLVPVVHENFRQWVLEDKFCAGRPEWEKVGVQFSSKVHQYEEQKIRILNAGHQIIANAAELLGMNTIDQALKHAGIYKLLKKVEVEEIIPHVEPLPDLTPTEYFKLILNRFLNPEIKDTIRRVAFDGSSRHSIFLVPSINDSIEKNNSIEGLALVEALWARMCQGIREDKSKIDDNDPIWDTLHSYAIDAKKNPLKWFELKDVYGNLKDDQSFKEEFTKWFRKIEELGVEKTINQYVSS
jgi:mannitol 2-dehydrogenase|tara:strand:- start:7 stop:1512 length:1506 start_codon:yes stop_codon:yes gene_type:complete